MKNRKTMNKSIIREYSLIVLGSLLTALSFNFFFIPNEIAPGGLSGLASVFYFLFDFPVGVTTLILNIPLFLTGIRQLGGIFGVRTLLATILLSVFIDLVKVPALTNDSLLASIYGGILMGLGLGIIFRMNATTGGTDLLAKLIHQHFASISVGLVLFMVDLAVVLLAGIFLGPSQGLYAVVALALSSKVVDLVQEGLNSAKAVFIISDQSEEISQWILKELDRGATLLNGKGAYTGKGKSVILCAVNRTQIAKLKGMIHEIDPAAFILVADVREVTGEGFSG